jgi:hypothetical protein
MQKTLFDGISNKPRDSRKERKTIAMRRYRASNPEKYKLNSSQSNKRWRARNKSRLSDFYKKYDLKRRYKLSVAAYAQMYKKQKGECAICQRPIKLHDMKTHVDHDHATGEVRGILCGHCNFMIGHAGENQEILRSAARYLAKFTRTRVNKLMPPKAPCCPLLDN